MTVTLTITEALAERARDWERRHRRQLPAEATDVVAWAFRESLGLGEPATDVLVLVDGDNGPAPRIDLVRPDAALTFAMPATLIPVVRWYDGFGPKPTLPLTVTLAEIPQEAAA